MTPSLSPAPRSGPRSVNACDGCRRRKVKCSGDQPCRTCMKNELVCSFGGSGRRRYSEAYVQRLLASVEAYKQQLQDLRRPIARASGIESGEDATPPTPSHGEAIGHAPGLGFEGQARSLFRDSRSTTQRQRQSSLLSTESQSRTETRQTRFQIPSCPLPSESESSEIFERFLETIGATQHLFDPRTFKDSMAVLFQSSEAQSEKISTLWFSQFLLVMAVGRMMKSPDSGTPEDDNINGQDFFEEAMKRLPPVHQLSRQGAVAVEILCLVGLWFQWCDREREAHLYFGTAVRVAVSNGCYQSCGERHGILPSEKVNRERAWWTAYVLDRRLSASLGLPAGVDNRQLRFDLPRVATGFPSPAPLNIKVRIARVIGDIMTDLYGRAAQSESELLGKIQAILESIQETENSIPSPYVLDFQAADLSISRTSASLYLMLFQATILCIRPIILQAVKSKLQPSDWVPHRAGMLKGRLCQAGNDAASKSIRILSALQQQSQIYPFGFFDLEATFSAAFITIMTAFVENGSETPPPGELRRAVEVLSHLSGAGNRNATRRLKDIEDFARYIWPRGLLLEPLSGTLDESAEALRSSSPSCSDAQQEIVIAPQVEAVDQLEDNGITGWGGSGNAG